MWRAWWISLHAAALHAAILPPPWADPNLNPCSTQPGGWLKLYWPQDGQCYRIFQRGPPCPDTMELSPGRLGAECRCPPGQVQTHEESPCYPINTRGPCLKGNFLAPLKDDARGRWGACKKVPSCPEAGRVFWPGNGGQCYAEYSRGPCPLGQLLVHNNQTGIAECGCEATGSLSRFYWGPTKSCHQFYTRGPCLEKGTLFLPGPQCGCHPDLPNYHPATGLCFEIGSSGPCKTGQFFSGKTEGCTCKTDHVPWLDGLCYRVFTKGPCTADQLLTPEGECRSLPCPRGKLYFPEEDSCHRVGVKGPCSRGQLVLFEQSVRPAVEGISYRGMCGCPGTGTCKEELIDTERSNKSQDDVEPTKVPRNTHIDYSSVRLCENVSGQEGCYQLYTQGPCLQGQWLVPNRHSRSKRGTQKSRIPSSVGVYMGHRFNPIGPQPAAEPHQQPSEQVLQLFQDGTSERRKGRCECRPGYTPLEGDQGCQLPLVTLAKFLNGQDYFK